MVLTAENATFLEELTVALERTGKVEGLCTPRMTTARSGTAFLRWGVSYRYACIACGFVGVCMYMYVRACVGV
jgi:hypothetical protein